MTAIAWEERMSVGYPVIDAQHRKLVELIAQLEEIIRKGGGGNRFEPVLTELERYTAIHLHFEEELLKQKGYPDLDSHRVLHDFMRSQVAKIRKQATVGSPDAAELLGFLMLWLKGHIEAEDQLYAEFLKAAGVKEIPVVPVP